MWVLVTFVLALLLSIGLATLVVLDRMFKLKKDLPADDEDSISLFKAIEAGERPFLSYIPFLLDFLRESSDRLVVVSSQSGMQSINMLHVLTSIWATGIDVWYAFGILLMLYTILLCSAAINFTWWLLLLLLAAWAVLATLVLLRGMKRNKTVEESTVQKHTLDKQDTADLDTPPPVSLVAKPSHSHSHSNVGPYTPIREWDVRELMPNPHDRRYMDYRAQPNAWRTVGAPSRIH
jgi:hypothetical protein